MTPQEEIEADRVTAHFSEPVHKTCRRYDLQPPFVARQAYLMLARYYSSSLGRFMAVDPGDDSALENPQSWNKYAYVRNNPLKTIDPKGKQGFPTNQQQLQQMTATAQAQQAASTPQAQAAGAQAQLDTAANMATAAGQAVCEVAPVMGSVYGPAATVAAASIPWTGPVGATAATEAFAVTVAADVATYVCEPSPETAANLAADVVGVKVAKDTAVALKNAPGLPLIKGAIADVAGEVAGAIVKAPVQKSAELISP